MSLFENSTFSINILALLSASLSYSLNLISMLTKSVVSKSSSKIPFNVELSLNIHNYSSWWHKRTLFKIGTDTPKKQGIYFSIFAQEECNVSNLSVSNDLVYNVDLSEENLQELGESYTILKCLRATISRLFMDLKPSSIHASVLLYPSKWLSVKKLLPLIE